MQTAACYKAPPFVWSERLLKLYETDEYGAREALLRHVDLLLGEAAMRELVDRFETRLGETLASVPNRGTRLCRLLLRAEN